MFSLVQVLKLIFVVVLAAVVTYLPLLLFSELGLNISDDGVGLPWIAFLFVFLVLYFGKGISSHLSWSEHKDGEWVPDLEKRKEKLIQFGINVICIEALIVLPLLIIWLVAPQTAEEMVSAGWVGSMMFGFTIIYVAVRIIYVAVRRFKNTRMDR